MPPTKRKRRDLSRREVKGVTAEHLKRAVSKILAGNVDPHFHQFHDSIKYDVVLRTVQRLPPKLVFAIAASEALGRKLGPYDFKGGEGTTCFHVLRKFGYEIVEKDLVAEAETKAHAQFAAWYAESSALTRHMARERAHGLIEAKQASFIREHGRLRCERCGFDPEPIHGPAGIVCIEVHDSAEVRFGEPAHPPALADLTCLCANCHRVAHERLAAETVFRS